MTTISRGLTNSGSPHLLLLLHPHFLLHPALLPPTTPSLSPCLSFDTGSITSILLRHGSRHPFLLLPPLRRRRCQQRRQQVRLQDPRLVPPALPPRDAPEPPGPGDPAPLRGLQDRPLAQRTVRSDPDLSVGRDAPGCDPLPAPGGAFGGHSRRLAPARNLR